MEQSQYEADGILSFPFFNRFTLWANPLQCVAQRRSREGGGGEGQHGTYWMQKLKASEG